MNVDGEYYRVINPDRIGIQLCSALEDGKLKTLMKRN